MPAVRDQAVNEAAADAGPQEARLLTPQELLAGSLLTYDVEVPLSILRPGDEEAAAAAGGRVRLRPLKVATLALIARAARDDPSLVPLLMIKESLVEPPLPLEQVRQMHAGLVNFLVAAVNRVSGLASGEGAVRHAADSAIGETHVQFAWYFGWTPAQVADLTPGQVAVYLAGIERQRTRDSEPQPAP